MQLEELSVEVETLRKKRDESEDALRRRDQRISILTKESQGLKRIFVCLSVTIRLEECLLFA